MTSRRASRRLAIDILYQTDVTKGDLARVQADWIDVRGPIDPFADELVEGVTQHAAEIDALLASRSEGWSVSRMAALDRTILRVAVFELLHRHDVPPAVAISEIGRAHV